jgi:hypothetical protein
MSTRIAGTAGPIRHLVTAFVAVVVLSTPLVIGTSSAYADEPELKTANNGRACDDDKSGDSEHGTLNSCRAGKDADAFPRAFAFCASEFAICHFIGTKTVAYGANGQFVYKTVTDSTPCNDSSFGDPIVGTVKACYVETQTYEYCAGEHNICRVSGTRTIAYGANGQFFYKTVSGDVLCGDRIFGDPIPGTLKTCYLETQTYTYCATERFVCPLGGTRIVAYGANGRFVYKTMTNSFACVNGVFGDPIPGTVKACYVAAQAYAYCARQNGACSFSGTRTIAYGANNRFVYKTAANGIACNNATFGNPLRGTTKACYIGTNEHFFPQSYTYCGTENDWCYFSGVRTIAYGANDRFDYKAEGHAASPSALLCSDIVFGNPTTGTVKSCYVVPQAYTYCAAEGDMCRFEGTKSVAYGADDRFAYKVGNGSIGCNATNFPSLPMSGAVKACYLK